jgi:hypothetical protein
MIHGRIPMRISRQAIAYGFLPKQKTARYRVAADRAVNAYFLPKRKLEANAIQPINPKIVHGRTFSSRTSEQ